MESYKVAITILGHDDDGNERLISQDATIDFSYDPDTYGNGYYMGITGKDEPFGCSCYDIRYDQDFDPKNKMAYIALFYDTMYSGERGAWKWKLKELSIKEVS